MGNRKSKIENTPMGENGGGYRQGVRARARCLAVPPPRIPHCHFPNAPFVVLRFFVPSCLRPPTSAKVRQRPPKGCARAPTLADLHQPPRKTPTAHKHPPRFVTYPVSLEPREAKRRRVARHGHFCDPKCLLSVMGVRLLKNYL